MQLKTILNRVLKHSAFVYVAQRLVETLAGPTLEVELRARANSRPRCSRCQRPGPGYDTLATRRFEFVPLWGMKVFFLYAPRRVNCARCGVRVEALPWAVGKHRLTTAYAWFLARWAKRLSWKEVAEVFHTSWDNVFHAVEMAVAWGREHRDLSAITAIGIDEVQWQRGHRYLTLVYQIDTHCKRLLWVGKERKLKTLLGFFRWFGKERSAGLKFVASDMWKPYLRVIAKKAGQAVHVLDRFHIMSHLSKAIDEVRASEVKALKAGGYEPVLKDSRWLLLKRPENLSEKQEIRLAELVQYNLKTVRAYLLKEDFQFFWGYKSWYWAGQFLDRWCKRTMRSRIDPMKKVARMLRAHRPLILNWFRAKGAISSGIVEGFNNKAKLSIRKAYGFRTFHGMEIALFHALGALPEPEGTHRFC
jgi:transposase